MQTASGAGIGGEVSGAAGTGTSGQGGRASGGDAGGFAGENLAQGGGEENGGAGLAAGGVAGVGGVTPSSASGGSAGRAGLAGTGGTPGHAGGMSAGGASGRFVHPGLIIRATDLARAKKKIADKAEPWFASYQLLDADPESSSTYKVDAPAPIIGRNASSAYSGTRYGAEGAAVVAFQNALLFALNGQTAHADKAVEVLNAYAKGTLHFDKGDPERDLEAAILGWLWLSAAELIRYNGYDHWAAADLQRFNGWIRNVVYDDSAYQAGGVLVTPLVNGAGARGAFGLRTKMAIGVYLDDRAIYDAAVDYFFHGKGNGAPDYYVNPITGQTWESGRDQGHAQGGLSRLIECAHIADTQGDPSLYAWKDGGLRRAIEYIASYNLGNEVPYSPMQPYTLSFSGVYDKISSEGRGMLATIYELPYGYYHGTLGVDLLQTRAAIAKEGVENFSPQNDNPMFATLLYRR